MKLRILQICNKVPYPPFEGGSIAMNTITRGLISAGHSVHVLAMNTAKQNLDIASLPESYKNEVNLQTVFIDNRVRPMPAFLNLFSRKSYHIQRFESSDFSLTIERILKSNPYDIIHLESLFLTPYLNVIRTNTQAKIVLRSHNIEHLIWKRTAAATKQFIKKSYLTHLAKKLKRYEIEYLNHYDGIAAITNHDKELYLKLGCKIPITDIPVAFERRCEILENIQSEKTTLFHLGSMDWMPNLEAVEWFLSNVWQKVHKNNPGLKLCLAGKNMPEHLRKLNMPMVDVLGEVKNSYEFMLSKGIMIVPLLSGSGMRVKILEGMALGKLIISTTIGAEGIQCKHMENIYIADTPQEFANAIDYCIQNPDFCETVGNNAKKLISQEYNNKKISEKLIAFYVELISERK